MQYDHNSTTWRKAYWDVRPGVNSDFRNDLTGARKQGQTSEGKRERGHLRALDKVVNIFERVGGVDWDVAGGCTGGDARVILQAVTGDTTRLRSDQ